MYRKGFGITPEGEGQYLVEEYGNSYSYNLVVINADLSHDGRHECETSSSSAFAEVILLGNVNIFTDY